MNRPKSATSWQPSPRPTRGLIALRVLGAGLLSAVVAQYLSGYFLLLLFGMNVRAATPLTTLKYGHYFGDNPDVRRRMVIASLLGWGTVGFVLFILLRRKPPSLHGDARFATRREIRNAGLFGTTGIVLGRVGRRYLLLGGQQGVALAAPPRAGKGVGFVIPNALQWPGSLICTDIKRENWTITAGYRQHCGQTCYLLDPFAQDGQSARWNPFFYVSQDPIPRVNDLQRIADMLYPDPATGDPFWTASARSLFLGCALYVFETPSLPCTIGEVLRQGMATDDEGFGQHWKRIIEGRSRGLFPLSPQCIRSLYDVIDLAPVTASSIRKTFTSRLDLWLNPLIDAATRENDFDLRDLRKKPISIYVGVNPDDLHRLRPVLSLFFQQAIGLQTRELPEQNRELKHQVLMLLDEFAALGRIPIISEAISYLPGYNVRVALVFHTPAQLREVYGPNAAETLLKSLAARIVFAPKDFTDAREISDELGYTTVKTRSVSTPLISLSTLSERKSRSQTVSEQKRALLLPQEVKELGNDDAIIFYEGLRPIGCRKIRYFQDRRFKARLLPPPKSEPGVRHPSIRICESEVGAGHVPNSATLEDLDRLDTLTLDDFANDFSPGSLPAEGKMTDAEMSAAVERFLTSLRAP